ncbi:MAG: hypothetical protein PF501_04965 [Salinisphaera sp.]|jgi:hypothetical protein|nr:hypothetical protein [Salinisphaera sp.]
MHNLKRQTHIAAACALALSAVIASAPAFAKKSQTEHVRGTIESTSNNGFTVKTNDGQMRKVTMSSSTRLSTVMPGDLSNIKKGTYIGTANVKRDGNNQALEMVIFPASMKGAGLGDYGWDMSPSMRQQLSGGGSQTSGSSMTNGTVTSNNSGSMAAGSSMTNGTVTSASGSSMSSGSSMTNGTVESKSSGSMSADDNSGSGNSSMTNGTVSKTSKSNQMLTLKVDYGKGSKTIQVPADVPTVKVGKGQKSDIVKGAHVFVAGPQGGNPLKAKFVAVGVNGTVPPM